MPSLNLSVEFVNLNLSKFVCPSMFCMYLLVELVLKFRLIAVIPLWSCK